MRTGGRTLRSRPAQLLCGAVAAPLFVSAFTAIGAARRGYDWRLLPVSSLAIGRRGWLQRSNFVVVGLLYSCAAHGLWHSPRPRVGPRAVPVLVAGVGVGLIGSGMFVTDPVGGFPSNSFDEVNPGGSSSGETGPSLAGRLHNLFATPIFAGIPVAGLASAISALRLSDYRWALYSAGSSLTMIASFVLFGIAFGDGSRLAGKGGVFQRISIGAGFGWLTALSLRALCSPVD